MLYAHPGLFYGLTLGAVVVFGIGMWNLITLVRLGNSRGHRASLITSSLPKIFLGKIILQTHLYRQSKFRWIMHLSIYWGFGALFLQTFTLTLLQWIVPHSNRVSIFFLQEGGKQILDFWGDFWGLVLVGGLIAALLRRYIFPGKQVLTLTEDSVILWFLLAIVLTGFFTEGVRLSLSNERTGLGFSFIGVIFAKLNIWIGIKDPMLMFWVHGVLSLGLIAYLPFSKLIHIITAPVETILSSGQAKRIKKNSGKREVLQ